MFFDYKKTITDTKPQLILPGIWVICTFSFDETDDSFSLPYQEQGKENFYEGDNEVGRNGFHYMKGSFFFKIIEDGPAHARNFINKYDSTENNKGN